tara:strand:- start:1089 stop:2531 length:1443 start_codon:yes stop_codon:yes gene_type:complete
MPSTIDYSSMLPLSIPAMAHRRKFFPSNGSTFSRQGNRQIRIEIGHPSALLDPTHSYLECRVSNTGGNTFGFDVGGTNCLFENVRVEQAGRLISYTQQNNRLHSSILAPVQMSSEGLATGGLTEFNRSFNGALLLSTLPRAAGQVGTEYDTATHNSDTIIGAGTIRMTMGITSGLFSQDKLIPLPLVDPNAPITLVLDLALPDDVGAWNAAPGAADLEIAEVAYIGHCIEVGPDVIAQFKQMQMDMGGQLAISGQDYEYFSAALPNGSSGQVQLDCPARKRSLKSMFWCAQSNDFANTAGPIVQSAAYNLSFCGNANIESYQLAVGPLLYPPGQPVQCWGQSNGAGAVGNEFRRGECALELAKAVGTLGMANPTGNLTCTSYGADDVGLASGENGVGGATHVPTAGTKYGFSPFGVSLDGFSRDVAESGVDTQTLAQQTRLQLNWAGNNNSGAEDMIVHMWLLFDQHYYFNMDGSVTYSN